MLASDRLVRLVSRRPFSLSGRRNDIEKGREAVGRGHRKSEGSRSRAGRTSVAGPDRVGADRVAPSMACVGLRERPRPPLGYRVGPRPRFRGHAALGTCATAGNGCGAGPAQDSASRPSRGGRIASSGHLGCAACRIRIRANAPEVDLLDGMCPICNARLQPAGRVADLLGFGLFDVGLGSASDRQFQTPPGPTLAG